MNDTPVKGSTKESATKVDARDANASRRDQPQPPLSKQPPAKGTPGAFAQEPRDDDAGSDPPLRKGLHASVPRD